MRRLKLENLILLGDLGFGDPSSLASNWRALVDAHQECSYVELPCARLAKIKNVSVNDGDFELELQAKDKQIEI